MAAISAALLVADEGHEIWVAAGRYEEHIHNRVVGDVAINVALFGGFAGGESTLAERNIAGNPTVIDGTATGIVVTITEDERPTTRIDAFYITGGSGIDGGVIRIVTAAPVIANNTIYLNMTNGLGVKLQIQPDNPETVRVGDVQGDLYDRRAARDSSEEASPRARRSRGKRKQGLPVLRRREVDFLRLASQISRTR
jgi:hypothetical protein